MLNFVGKGPNCVYLNGVFAINSSFGFGNSADIWRSSFANVF